MCNPAILARSRSVGTFTRAAALATFLVGATLLVGLAPPLHAQVVTRVSVGSAGEEANQFSDEPQISADGRFVAFMSVASNLVAVPVFPGENVFVRDLDNATTECVSVATSGAAGDLASWSPALSADGRFVAFSSDATNLVPDDTNGVTDVFVRDRVAGTTERVSTFTRGEQGNWSSGAPAISGGGRFVAFESLATNLVAGDTNGHKDVFVHDRLTGTTERVSVNSAGREAIGDSFEAVISADGSVVAFASWASDLVDDDRNGCIDVFVRDRTAALTERVSVDSSGGEATQDCDRPALSSDGNVVAFDSAASNLVVGDTNPFYDIFVHDRAGGFTERASVDPSGAGLKGDSFSATLSAHGNVVAFTSVAKLTAADGNGTYDILLRDRAAGATTLVSVNCAWAAGNGISDVSSISDDGTRVAFISRATDLVDGDTSPRLDVFLNDLAAPPVAATWSNYGAGFAGTLGVPALTASAAPVFDTTISIDATDSSGTITLGLLLVGLAPASIPTSAGGTLLVDVLQETLFVLLPSGQSFSEHVPRDPQLCGLSIYLQVLELDAGAAKGVSFTPGLQLTVGH